MSKGYTNTGKRISSMAHAKHGWTCSCGKKVWGNGGRSSHQRACLVYMREMLAFHERMVNENIENGDRLGILDRHGHAADVLRKQIEAKLSRTGVTR